MSERTEGKRDYGLGEIRRARSIFEDAVKDWPATKELHEALAAFDDLEKSFAPAAQPPSPQPTTPTNELRDSICREMFECGFDELTDPIKRVIVNRRWEQVCTLPAEPSPQSSADQKPQTFREWIYAIAQPNATLNEERIADLEPLANAYGADLRQQLAEAQRRLHKAEGDRDSFYHQLAGTERRAEQAESALSAARAEQDLFISQLDEALGIANDGKVWFNTGRLARAKTLLDREAEREKLVEALRQYGVHDKTCPEWDQKWNRIKADKEGIAFAIDTAWPCNCGFNEALAALPTSGEPIDKKEPSTP